MSRPRLPRSPRQRWIKSWKGLESYRDQIRSIAQEVATSDLVVRSRYPPAIATGMICGAMRDPSTSPCPEVYRAAKAQNKLAALHTFLVSVKKLDFDFVRREWAPILDPRPEELELCNRLV